MIDAGHILADKYRLERSLGAGGMGQVFAATNLHTGRRVAIKVIHPEYAKSEEVIARFMQEARAASRVRHPNIVDVLDLDIAREDGIPYIVQEYLDGRSLDVALREAPSGSLAPRRALEVLVPVMRALVAAHREGVIHRDLKPGNVFLCAQPDGAELVKVIDFGIARVGPEPGEHDPAVRTRTGTMLGTPAYMSPEQVCGERDLDGRSDVWAVGAMLYECLCGSLPFEGSNVNVVIGKVLHEDPTPLASRAPSVPAELCALVHRALARDRRARFDSMQALLDATLATTVWRDPDVSQSPTMPATPQPTPRAVEVRARRGPSRSTVVAALCAALALLCTALAWTTRPSTASTTSNASPPRAPMTNTHAAPSMVAPSMVAPSIAAPSMVAPSIAAPSMVAPSTVAPSTVAPSITAPEPPRRVVHRAPSRDPLAPARIGDYGHP